MCVLKTQHSNLKSHFFRDSGGHGGFGGFSGVHLRNPGSSFLFLLWDEVGTRYNEILMLSLCFFVTASMVREHFWYF